MWINDNYILIGRLQFFILESFLKILLYIFPQFLVKPPPKNHLMLALIAPNFTTY
jgi:hypothetical protein